MSSLGKGVFLNEAISSSKFPARLRKACCCKIVEAKVQSYLTSTSDSAALRQPRTGRWCAWRHTLPHRFSASHEMLKQRSGTLSPSSTHRRLPVMFIIVAIPQLECMAQCKPFAAFCRYGDHSVHPAEQPCSEAQLERCCHGKPAYPNATIA
jgi:hypothetical protein